MTTVDTKSHWNTVYRTKLPDEVSWYEKAPILSRQLVRTYANPNDAVVDIGSGASRLSGALLRDGFTDLTMVDISGEALTVAQRGLGSDASMIKRIEADIREWRPNRRYALWHDRAVFHFFTNVEDRGAYAETLKRALSPAGVAVIGTFAPDGPEMCSGLTVMRHDAESLLSVFGSGFTLVETRPHEHLTPKGSVQRFQFSVFRRRG